VAVEVQFAIYAVVDGTNDEFRDSYNTSVNQQIESIFPLLVEMELLRLDQVLQDIEKDFANALPNSDSARVVAHVDRLNASNLADDNRFMILSDSTGMLL